MAMPQGWSFGDPCPVCGSNTYDNRSSKRSPNAPDAKCSNQQCQAKGGKPWAAWITSFGSGGQQQAPQQQRANGAAPQGQRQAPAQSSMRQQVGFDTVLHAAGDAIASIGGSLATVAKHEGIDLSNPTAQAGWFAAVSSVACSFVIAVSDGRLRIGSEPEPAKPETAMDRHKRAIATAQDKAACLRCMAAFTADDTLFPNEKSDLDLLADAKLDALKAADKAEGGMLSN